MTSSLGSLTHGPHSLNNNTVDHSKQIRVEYFLQYPNSSMHKINMEVIITIIHESVEFVCGSCGCGPVWCMGSFININDYLQLFTHTANYSGLQSNE